MSGKANGNGPGTGDLLRWSGFGAALLLTGASWAGLAVARSMPDATTLPLAASVTGVGLLVLSWALLGRVVLTSRTPPNGRWLRWTLLLWCTPLLAAPPLFSNDVFSYLAQGEIAARGLNPYLVGPASGLGATSEIVERVAVYWRDTPSPYGPLFGAIERLIAQASAGDIVQGIILHRLVEVLGLLLVLWATPRLATAAGVPQRTALWLGVLNPLVLGHFVAGVHNDSLMMGLLLAGTAITVEAIEQQIKWRPLLLGVVLIALGTQVKLPALVALAAVGTALARRRGGRVSDLLLAAASMVLVFAGVSTLISLLTGLGFGWSQALGTPGQVNSWMAPTNWVGFLAGGVGAVFGAQITQTAIGVGRFVGYVLMVCGIAFVLHRQLRGRIDQVASLGMMLGLVVLLGPVVQPWYLLWAVIPLAASLPPGRALSGLAALVTIFAVLVPPSAGNFANRIGQLVTAYAVGIVLTGVALLLLRRTGARTAPDNVAVPLIGKSRPGAMPHHDQELG
ncbi:polyprenol phosphomannose-dependent alpha 1,6 mannosyltransferase MptB [Kutzneria viridogrisea]